MVYYSSLKIENFENLRTSKNVSYIFYGLLHFLNDFYIMHNVLYIFGGIKWGIRATNYPNWISYSLPPHSYTFYLLPLTDTPIYLVLLLPHLLLLCSPWPAPGQGCCNLVQHYPPEKLSIKFFFKSIAPNKMAIQQSNTNKPGKHMMH